MMVEVEASDHQRFQSENNKPESPSWRTAQALKKVYAKGLETFKRTEAS